MHVTSGAATDGGSASTRPGGGDVLFREAFGALRREHRLHPTSGRLVASSVGGEAVRGFGFSVLQRQFHTVFLPEGFPSSVGPDYVTYQLFDIAQALASAVTGTLSTRAVLAGVGVGESSANVISGTLQWIVRDGTGMLGRIYFASRIASDLDNDMKRWRIAADVCNDIGIMLEIACSMVPRSYFVPLVCSAAIIKAVTAVAGQATRSTMAQHFARRDNMADISAKNASQETAVSFIGMFIGMAVAAFVPPTVFYNTLVFVLVTVVHIALNVRAVRALVLTHFNQVRLDIAVALFVKHERGRGGSTTEDNDDAAAENFPTPSDMRHIEGIVNQNPHAVHLPKPTGSVELGACLSTLVGRLSGSAASNLAGEVVHHVRDAGFAIVADLHAHTYHIILGEGVKTMQIMRAYLLTQFSPSPKAAEGAGESSLCLVAPTAHAVDQHDRFMALAGKKGWALDRALFKLKEWRVEAGHDHLAEPGHA